MNHLTNDLLIRHIDDELSPPELRLVEAHLQICDGCRSSFVALRKTSSALDDFLLSLQPDVIESERVLLAKALACQQDDLSKELRARTHGTSPTNLRRPFWLAPVRSQWAVALAASLAAGILYFGINVWQTGYGKDKSSDRGEPTASLVSFDIDGETFLALPYSNPDLPVSAPRVVQMEVPVASLADAGIMVEPVASRAAMPDRSVLADVLLGLDGQPLGVHLVSTD